MKERRGGGGKEESEEASLLQWPATGVSLGLSVTPETMLARWGRRREGPREGGKGREMWKKGTYKK